MLTGTPVRSEFLARSNRPAARPFVLLIFGGSQGARAINRAVVDGLDRLRPHLCELRFIHQTGEQDFVRVEQPIGRREPGPGSSPFLTICRASSRKLTWFCVGPAPRPWGVGGVRQGLPAGSLSGRHDNHQLRNAESLAAAGAAEVIRQEELNGASSPAGSSTISITRSSWSDGSPERPVGPARFGPKDRDLIGDVAGLGVMGRVLPRNRFRRQIGSGRHLEEAG